MILCHFQCLEPWTSSTHGRVISLFGFSMWGPPYFRHPHDYWMSLFYIGSSEINNSHHALLLQYFLDRNRRRPYILLFTFYSRFEHLKWRRPFKYCIWIDYFYWWKCVFYRFRWLFERNRRRWIWVCVRKFICYLFIGLTEPSFLSLFLSLTDQHRPKQLPSLNQ